MGHWVCEHCNPKNLSIQNWSKTAAMPRYFQHFNMSFQEFGCFKKQNTSIVFVTIDFKFCYIKCFNVVSHSCMYLSITSGSFRQCVNMKLVLGFSFPTTVSPSTIFSFPLWDSVQKNIKALPFHSFCAAVSIPISTLLHISHKDGQ